MRRRLASALLGLSALFSAPAGAETPSIPFEKYTLPNGLTVILSEDHKLPVVSVNIWYHVGAINEAPGKSGFAHLFEHVMFQGSKHVPEDMYFAILEGAGASESNGTTDFDRTNYFETVPSNQLELALWLESDRMGFLLDTLTKERLDGQREVVKNERRQSVDNVPYGRAEERLYQLLFPAPHPYYGYVIGSMQDLDAASLDDVKSFFRSYYSPANASLAIVGDFDPASAKALIEKYFGPIKGGEKPPFPAVETKPIVGERRETLKDQVQLPRLYMGWIGPLAYRRGAAEADFMAKILGGGKSSRLYERLVYEKKIAQDVTAYSYPLVLGSIFVIQATAKPGHTLAELEAEIKAELDRAKSAEVSAEELARAKRAYLSAFYKGLERLGGFGGKADQLQTYEHYFGDPAKLEDDLTRHERVDAADLKKFAGEYLRDDARVVVLVEPEGGEGEPAAEKGGKKGKKEKKEKKEKKGKKPK